MKYTKWALTLVTATAFGMTAWATEQPLSITADELTYDGATQTATAVGNVVIEQQGERLTGSRGTYHMDTQTASLEGGVHMTGPRLQGSAERIEAAAHGSIVASGAVHFMQGADSLTGSTVTYDPATGYGVVTGGSVQASGTHMTAPHIEAWLHAIRLQGTGGVEIENPAQQVYARGQSITYTQTPGQDDGVAYLEGDAYAVQQGNTLTGPSLTIRMADHSVSTQQRSTLVITR